jgi:hypothetical protein
MHLCSRCSTTATHDPQLAFAKLSNIVRKRLIKRESLLRRWQRVGLLSMIHGRLLHALFAAAAAVAVTSNPEVCLAAAFTAAAGITTCMTSTCAIYSSKGLLGGFGAAAGAAAAVLLLLLPVAGQRSQSKPGEPN